MDSPAREMQEMDEFVLVPHAADLWSYQLDEDDDAHESDARFFAGNDEKTIDEPECKEWEGDHGHGWQQHAVGVICSGGLAAAATGLALLLGGQQQTPHKVHFRAAGGRKVTKVSARRDARLEQGMSVPRFEHAPAMISFGGSYGGHLF
uniref:DUF6821 domain-containing protein n=1 Tax=Aegilops tauschii TaxID=37682 RepID=M8C763_AEGTA